MRDGVLQRVERFYYWDTQKASELVGITRQELRQGRASEKLDAYLMTVVEEYPELFG